ncbi:hypothetical protein DMN91_002348 [Ooceraea biroi]|uniref:Cyclic nucleotide-binding domain-containing protein n=1 Tax=Ooceraea biroi TaxID=2015173 RepID=A0A026WE35_OOCBI|nr:uncharacterized protein LOC105280096 [Ooceraea biroi]EZA54365.1 hypothetical protein X777_05595 [Ooceraea biroi]RLU26182.1 hypothetical protein DMN91_002348 [Ooceraea biroi]
MSLYTKRRSSLRQSLGKALLRKSLLVIRPNRLRGRYLFRSAVRRVLEYMEWITEEPVVEEITDDVTINIRMALQKTTEKKLLTLEDRSILLVNPSERSSTDKAYIHDLMRKLRAFPKYSEELKEQLAAVCVYQYLPAGRVIVRQGHKARNLYFIAHGEVELSKVTVDQLTGDEKVVDMGIMQAGNMFGEVALLHTIPRTATVVTKTSVDLLLITEDDFDSILRYTLLKKWDVLRDALVHFNYFKLWDEETVRECCILSKLKDFKPNEVLLGDGKGMVNYVHFVLSGECRLIEHMLVHECPSYHGMQYELYDSECLGPQEQVEKVSKKVAEPNESPELNYKSNRMRAETHTDADQLSIVTTTLLDVVRAWHEITDIAAMLMREPSVTSELRYPSDVRTMFMQVCIFSRGACFGLGERMVDRRIVAITPVRCFLIPRYWLLEHNRANIWGRVRLFMDSKYPTKKQLFDEFVLNRKWMTYKQNLMKDIIKRRGRYRSNTTIHDVPYSIRITDEIDQII